MRWQESSGNQSKTSWFSLLSTSTHFTTTYLWNAENKQKTKSHSTAQRPSKKTEWESNAPQLLLTKPELKNSTFPRCGPPPTAHSERFSMELCSENQLSAKISPEFANNGLSQSSSEDILSVTNTNAKTLSFQEKAQSKWYTQPRMEKKPPTKLLILTLKEVLL